MQAFNTGKFQSIILCFFSRKAAYLHYLPKLLVCQVSCQSKRDRSYVAHSLSYPIALFPRAVNEHIVRSSLQQLLPMGMLRTNLDGCSKGNVIVNLLFRVTKSLVTCPFDRCLVLQAYVKVWAYVYLFRSILFMPLVSDTSESNTQNKNLSQKRSFITPLFRLPRNVYILLIFTTGKGFQLSISTLTLNYYVHSLGYQPEFIGIFSAMPAIGALISAVPVGFLADRIGRKPVLVLTAILTPVFLAACALVTSPFLLLSCAFLQGVVSTAYWVTNLPLLTESTTERQRVGVLALNSFLLLGIGSLGSLLGGAIPEVMAGILHVSAASTLALRWGVFAAALFTFVFGLPLWFLREPKRTTAHRATAKAPKAVLEENVRNSGPLAEAVLHEKRERLPVALFVKLLVPDLLFTMGEGAVVALM